jgi:hypothetical protein
MTNSVKNDIQGFMKGGCKMKVYGTICLMAMLVLSGVGVCAEGEKAKMPPVQGAEQQMKVRRMQRQMEAEEKEFKIDQAMRGLELEKKRIEVENMRKGPKEAGWKKHHYEGAKGAFILGIVVVHILLTLWVYGDIKERGKGSVIWVAVVLLAGILGTIPYTIVRLGDVREAKA